jgi:hypothetical protein
MKVKIEYAMLLIVIVALGLYLFFRDTDRATYTLPDLPAVKTGDLTKIEIQKGDQIVVLTRGDDGWQVSPGDYPADVSRITPMLDALAELQVTALVSESRNYARYELDETRQIRVSAFNGDNAVRNVLIGKAADTWRHTHIRLSDDPNVYHARGNFRQDFDQSVESLRDKTVLAFKKDDVTEFAIETGDRRIVLRKSNSPQPEKGDAAPTEAGSEKADAPEWTTADGQTVAKETVDRLLTDLSGLKCRAYLTDRAKADFTDPAYRISIGSSETALLEVFAPADDTATEMPARSSLRNEPFTLADFDVDPVKDFLSALDGSEAKTTP